MRRPLTAACIFTFFIVFLSPAQAQEQDGDEEYTYKSTVKKAYGHNFRAPEDMPIQKFPGGLVMPIDTDEYAAMKYSKVISRVDNMEGSLKQLKNELASIRDDIKKLQQKTLVSK